MDAIDIKNQLRAKYRELQDYARINGIHPVQLSQTINRARKYPEIRRMIARDLGLPVEQVFPEPPISPCA